MYRDDNIHLTKKGNDILVRWMHYKLGGTIKHQLVPPPILLPLGRFGLKMGIYFAYFDLELGMVFLGITGAYEHSYRFNSK